MVSMASAHPGVIQLVLVPSIHFCAIPFTGAHCIPGVASRVGTVGGGGAPGAYAIREELGGLAPAVACPGEKRYCHSGTAR